MRAGIFDFPISKLSETMICPKHRPSSETQGRLVGARGNKSGKEMKRRRFTSKAEKAPGNRLLPDHFQTALPMLPPDWAENPLYYSAQPVSSSSWGTVVCSYTTTIASPYLLGSFINVLHAVETFILISLESGEISK